MGGGKVAVVKFLSWLFWSWLLISRALAETHYYSFVVRSATYTKLCETKDILTVNGTFPGPTLTVHRGDTVFIEAVNNATDNITLHWHGLKQPRDPWHDGPEYITQCPIQSGGKFIYKLNFTSEEGTIWWHAHSDWTRATVHGAIIIHPPIGTSYPFATPHRDVPLILGQWWTQDIMELMEETIELGGGVAASDAFTINGQPGDLYPCSENGTFRVQVQQGKTYLLRVINAALISEFFFAIANHSLTVVGQDGSYTKPLTTSYIMITPGQSYDLLLTANQNPNLLYYMAAHVYISSDGAPYDKNTTTAILQYDGYNQSNVDILLPDLPAHNDTDAASEFFNGLRSLASEDHPISVPQYIDKHLFFTVSVNRLDCNTSTCESDTRFAASINNISFTHPSIDILSAYAGDISNVYDPHFPAKPPFYFNFTAEDQPESYLYTEVGTNVTVLKYNTSVELVLQGTSLLGGENHPFHLHGFSFFVVGNGSGNFDYEENRRFYNLMDPPEMNTVGVPKNGWVALRFFAANPGVWFMHCHLDHHVTWGMNTVFIVRNGSQPEEQLLPPPLYRPSC